MIGQGRDGAATFSGKISGVQKRIQISSAHAIYIHCKSGGEESDKEESLNSGSISDGDKVVFWNNDQRLEVVLLFPPKSRGIEGHPGCSWFSRAEDHEA